MKRSARANSNHGPKICVSSGNLMVQFPAMPTAYENLVALTRELQILKDTAGLLSWDQEAKLPRKGVAWRVRVWPTATPIQ